MAYFANAGEGFVLENQCAECPLGDTACPIAVVQLAYNYDQMREGQEMLRRALERLVDQKGICLMLKALREGGLVHG